ncbi:MAG: hypothetical protein ACREI7_11360, partial [Myxococcota bacterium]
ELGGLAAAIDHAKTRAGIALHERVRIVELPKPQGGLLNFLLSNIVRAEAPQLGIGDLAILKQLLRAVPPSLLVAPETPQARLPFEIIWE